MATIRQFQLLDLPAGQGGLLSFCYRDSGLQVNPRDRDGSTGIEITRLFDRRSISLGSVPAFHAGDRGSNPLGDANNIRHLLIR